MITENETKLVQLVRELALGVEEPTKENLELFHKLDKEYVANQSKDKYSIYYASPMGYYHHKMDTSSDAVLEICIERLCNAGISVKAVNNHTGKEEIYK